MRGHALLLCACLPLLAGCAVFAGSGGGPGGLGRFDADLRALAVRGDFERALELTEGESAPGDDLLRALQRAAVLRHAGQFEESNRLLQEAELEIEDRYTRSVSKAALSLVTNDRVLAWRPSRVERMLLHCYGALNYLALGDPEEAAVEARRLSALLEAEDLEAFTGGADLAPDERRMRRAMRAIAGVVFEAAGEWNDAGVAWRNAGAGVAGRPGLDGRTDPAGSLDPEARLRSSPALPPDSGEVVVIVESGFIAHRVERSVRVPIYRRDTDHLDDHDASVRRDAALCVAARAFGPGGEGLPAGLFGGFTSSELRRCGRRAGRSLYVLAIAWPAVQSTPDPVRGGTLRIRTAASEGSAEPAPTSALPASTSAGGSAELPVSAAGSALSEADAPLRLGADLSAAYAAEQQAGLAGAIVKSVLRAAAKHAIVEAMREKAEKEDETLGDAVGLLGNAIAVASEHADTRSWNLLPGALHVARVRVPAGRHEVSVELHRAAASLGAGASAPARHDLGEVDVRGGTVRVLSLRSWP